MPMETTAEYSRFTSMGKKGIEEKERTGKKQRKGKEREGKERKGKERKGKERNIIGEKDKRREEDTIKRNRFPHRAQTRGYSGERNA